MKIIFQRRDFHVQFNWALLSELAIKAMRSVKYVLVEKLTCFTSK